ncbi:MAG: ribosome biogenesis GTP-binding protein YihA/YsxC [Christensenellales bacterium]
MQIAKTKLVSTAYKPGQYAPQPLREVAVVGRSNAGKSSLVNTICNNKKLARVSSAPGKTRSINFYNIDNALMLVDLPGYGFAKRSGKEREDWGRLVDDYFAKSQTLLHLLLLCDIRHDAGAGDLQMAEWLQLSNSIPRATRRTRLPKANVAHGPAAGKAGGGRIYLLSALTAPASGGAGTAEAVSTAPWKDNIREKGAVVSLFCCVKKPVNGEFFMIIREIRHYKKQCLPLMLLADEQESMIDTYLPRGLLYVLYDRGLKCECVVTDEDGILEIKNIATEPAYQKQGYGRAMIEFLVNLCRPVQRFAGRHRDSPLTVLFYEKCGFVYSIA